MKIDAKKLFIPAVVPVLLILASLFFQPAATFIANTDSDLLHILRGDRTFSDDVFLIYIDSQEAAELGGWPMTRDYYGYLIYVLKQAGAKVIALNILLPTKDTRYPEFDRDLTHFVRTARNVVMPFTYRYLVDTIKKNGIVLDLAMRRNCLLTSLTDSCWALDSAILQTKP